MSRPKTKVFGSLHKILKGDNPTQPSGTLDIANPSSSSQAITTLTSTKNLAPAPVPTFDPAPTTMLGTPVPGQDGSRQLNCLIEGESIVFPVTMGCDCVVGDLKEKIKMKRALGILKDPHTLELWKVNIDLNTHNEDSVSHLTLGEIGESVEKLTWKSLREYWPDQPPMMHLHIIVKVPAPTEWFTEPSTLRKRSRVDTEGNDLSALQEKQIKRYRTGENPSTVCKDARFMQSQQDYAEILNGRPWTSSGPPVGLYHPVFDNFSAYFKESTLDYRTASSADPEDSRPSFDVAFKFMRASSEFYDVEQSGRVDEDPPTGRMEAVLPAFERLLCVSLPQVKSADRTEPDARVMAMTPAGNDGPLAVVEVKLELGIDGDAKTQAQQSYARICSLPKHAPVRLSSCSPCFLVEIAGPWITVFGAVCVQKVIVQRLAGPIYLPPQFLHPNSTIDTPLRLFSALRRALRDLRQYYEHLAPQTTVSRFFPFVRSYTLPSGVTMNLDYEELLSPDDSRAIYLAKQADGRKVVVKFALTYNTHGHCLLADNGLAPELIYDGTKGPRYGGLLMIVMDYVKGQTLSKFLQSSPHPNRLNAIITSVKKAIALLHAENLVFGDLRTPNILVDDDVKLIDYDWCGIHQVGRYPFIIGDAIEWASGVGSFATMHKDHDLYMLKRLEANIRAGTRPGVW